jgi:outer membrane lipoprotein-sorting protein
MPPTPRPSPTPTLRSASVPLAAFVLFTLIGQGVRAAPTPTPQRPRVAQPATPAGSDARPLIVAAAAAPKHVSFVGQMSSIRSGATRALAVVSKIEHRAPDETRRTYLAPQVLYGQVVISRGAMSWNIDPAHTRVVVSENRAAVDPVAVVDDIALLDSNYRAVRSASDDVANRKADVVDLVSRYTGERAMRLWLDAQTHVVLAKEAYHSDGSLSWRTRFDDIRYTNDIPEAIFVSTVPAGYATIRGRSYKEPQALPSAIPDAGFKPITPKYLPDGFSLVGSDVSEVRNVRNLHLIYSDGVRTLSLFENATNRLANFGALKVQTTNFDNHDAKYVRDGPTMLLVWREEGLSFTLVGDLELKELVRIAISVVP